ncbi:MAG: hypothetical protein E3J46_05610 [Desulfobacteraceae bacterium]|nr:MAG: hypothetical protein E3J46_05610 [Desulfobacteraceae bacterium]
MFNPPFSGSIPIYIALGLLIISLALLIGLIYRRVKRLIRRLKRRSVVQVGIVTSTLKLLMILLMVVFSAATLFLLAFIQSYTAFTHRKHVATVYCTPEPNVKDEMVLNLVTIESPTVGLLQRYRLHGQQWAIEGHILKWENWLNFLGFQTMYKLTRVRGRYLRAEDETSKPSSAYSLVANEEDSRWRFLYEYGPCLPFVNAVYGNTVFTFPSTTKTFQIFVTTSGFMIEESE